MTKTIALVSCVGEKLAEPAEAQDLYTSPWFKKARVCAESLAQDWCILSAKYGLVRPETRIAPYNRSLTNMCAGDRRAWAYGVMGQLREIVAPGDHIILLAGKHYREFLVGPLRALGCSVETPMARMRIGEQLRWLTHECRGTSGK